MGQRMLKLTHRNLDWMDKALCKELPSDMFFPENSAYLMAKEAKKACSLCAVRLECLDYALSIPGLTGVFGGTTEYDRIRLKRKMQRHLNPQNTKGDKNNDAGQPHY